MRDTILQHKIVESLVELGHKLGRGIPPDVETAALAANPWFTPFYLQESLKGILGWLTESTLTEFVASYPPPSHAPQRIGVIAAGNVPLVGFHDVLMGLLSGHRVYVKYARRDRVMMHWVRQQWIEIWPAIGQFYLSVDTLPEIDYLLATGSNNSARYVRQAFPHTPKLIRKHRYSVAVVTGEMTDDALYGLNRDILLYNGLGCRNVSSILYTQDFSLNRLRDSLSNYPKNWINPLYLERVLYLTAKNRVLGKTLTSTPYALLQSADQPLDLGMGLISLVAIDETRKSWKLWQAEYQAQWQCIVGKTVAFGQAQQPKLTEFADGVDTMNLLVNLT